MTSTEIAKLHQFMVEEFTLLRAEMNSGFAAIQAQFDAINVRFDSIHGNFSTIELEQTAQNSQLYRHEQTLISLTGKKNLG